jgi:hypothetical protein
LRKIDWTKRVFQLEKRICCEIFCGRTTTQNTSCGQFSRKNRTAIRVFDNIFIFLIGHKIPGGNPFRKNRIVNATTCFLVETCVRRKTFQTRASRKTTSPCQILSKTSSYFHVFFHVGKKVFFDGSTFGTRVVTQKTNCVFRARKIVFGVANSNPLLHTPPPLHSSTHTTHTPLLSDQRPVFD